MPHQENERIEALKRMLSEKDQEVVAFERMEQMMEEELSKNDKDIDTDYVDELAQMILEHRRCQPAGEASSARKKQSHRMRSRIARVAVMILAVGVVLTISTTKIAGAFDWIDIVKFLSPFMEQLGISVNIDSDEELNLVKKPGEDEAEQDGEEWGELLDVVLYDEEELPESIEGYPVKPPYLPEGYAFERADMYFDGMLTNIGMTFSSGEQEVYIQIRVYTQEIGGDIVVAEQKAEELPLERIDVFQDYDIITAVMELDTCHYSVWGKESEEEICKILQGYEGEIFG